MSKGTLDLGQSVPRGTEEHAESVAGRQSPAAGEEAEEAVVEPDEAEEVSS